MPAFGRRSSFILTMGGSPLRVSYIGLFTLTDVQRAREFLGRRGIRALIARMPSEPGVSCAYGLKLKTLDAEEARRLLESNRFRLGKTVERHEKTG